MRRIVIASLILVVLSPTVATAAAWYRCAVDGEMRAACCCPAEKDDEEQAPADATPDLRPACCCDIETAGVSPSQVRIAVEGTSAALVFTIPRSIIEVQSPQMAAELRPVPEVARPSSRAPPLFLANCSLLI